LSRSDTEKIQKRYLRYDPDKMIALRTKLEKTIKNIL